MVRRKANSNRWACFAGSGEVALQGEKLGSSDQGVMMRISPLTNQRTSGMLYQNLRNIMRRHEAGRETARRFAFRQWGMRNSGRKEDA